MLVRNRLVLERTVQGFHYLIVNFCDIREAAGGMLQTLVAALSMNVSYLTKTCREASPGCDAPAPIFLVYALSFWNT